MRSRLAVLKRLLNMYEAIEDIHAAELQRADAAVREVQEAISRQQEIMSSARDGRREAFDTGDSMARGLAELARDVADTRRRRLEPVRVDRESLRDAADRQHATSRVKSEQIGRLAARAAEQIEIEDTRKAQAVSDDRFLSRRSWKNGSQLSQPALDK